MKKLVSIIAVAAVVIGMSFVSCNSQTVGKAVLKTDVDTLSYLVGMDMSNGIEQFFEQNGINENKEDFFKGLAEAVKMKQDDKKTAARILGLQIGFNMAQQWIPGTEENFFHGDSTMSLNKEALLNAFIAAAGGQETLISKEDSQAKIQEITKRISEKVNAETIAANTKFLEENKTKEGVMTTESGLQYKVITEAAGEKPVATDRVRVHYHGTTIDGTVFDSSVERDTPAQFALNGVIPGWTEGLQLMPVGSKYIFYIPSDLAYGERGSGPKVGPFATLIFEVELLEILK